MSRTCESFGDLGKVSDFGHLRKVSDFGVISGCKLIIHCICIKYTYAQYVIEGSLEVKLPTIWTDEKQSREEAERRERLEERRVEEKEYKKKEDADA